METEPGGAGPPAMQPAEFESMASVEDRHWWFLGKRSIVMHLLRKAGVSGKILDAGCGTGGNLPQLSALGEAVGAEPNPLAFKLAQQKFSGTIVQAELTNLPFPDGEFGGAITTDVMEHVADDRAALAELTRVLKPGGTLILTVPAHPFMWSGHDVALGHVRRYTLQGFRELMRSQPELELETLSYFNAVSFPFAALQRWIRGRRERAQGYPDLVTDTASVPAAPVNWIASQLFAAERFLLGWFQVPMGVSIMAIFRKKEPSAPPRELPEPLTLGSLLLAALGLILVSLPSFTGEWLDGHEGPSYLFRLAEFHQMLAQGEWYPRWMPDFYWGYGYPIFVFYSPGLFFAGSFLMELGASPISALHALVVLSHLLFLAGSYQFASRFTPSRPVALAGATIAALTHYRFVQPYIRADLSETFATSFVPWALAEAVTLGCGWNHRAFVRLGVFLALAWYSHTLTGFALSAAMLVMGIYQLIRSHWRAFFRIGLASWLGMGLAAVYWMPASLERPHVSTERMIEADHNGAEIADHFVYPLQRLKPDFYYGDSIPGDGDRMSFATSWVFWLLLVSMLFWMTSEPGWRKRAGPLLLAWGLINFLMMNVSRPVWAALPLIEFFQFPWRLLLIDAAVIAPIAALALHRLAQKPLNPAMTAAVIAAALGLFAWQFSIVVHNEYFDTLVGRYAGRTKIGWYWPLAIVLVTGAYLVVFSLLSALRAPVKLAAAAAVLFAIPMAASTSMRAMYNGARFDPGLLATLDNPAEMQRYGLVLPTGEIIPVKTAAQDEYLPRTANVPRDRPPELPARMLTGSGMAVPLYQRGDLRHYRAKIAEPGVLELAYFYYPGVEASLNGLPAAIAISERGLVSLEVPAGEHQIDVWYGSTPAQDGGALASILALILAIAIWQWGGKKNVRSA